MYEEDACFPSPCGENGVCSKFGFNGYTCQCYYGYTGTNCEIRKNQENNFHRLNKYVYIQY